MQKESKLYFWDTAGKFDAVKEEAHNVCRYTHDLTIYSLTPIGEKEPTRLVLKMTPIGHPNDYLSVRRLDIEEATVSMFSLNYRTFPPRRLKMVCENIRPATSSYLVRKHYVKFGQCNDENRFDHITVADFFGIDPRRDDPGAQIYLRDKAFFLSMLPDPTKPDFFALPLLTDAQKAKVTSIDLSHADVCGKQNLNRLFLGYTSVKQLDLSTFDTTSATSMEAMFYNCTSLRRMNLSTFDFSHVTNLSNMFGLCRSLEEVILSDTILNAGSIPHATGQYVTEYENTWSGAHTPSQADFSGTLSAVSVPEKINVPFGKATQEEALGHLGLIDYFAEAFRNGQRKKVTIVPHRSCPK